MKSITFNELKSALEDGPECILALEKRKDGGIMVAKIYGEGTRHSVGYSMALIDRQARPDQLFIKALV